MRRGASDESENFSFSIAQAMDIAQSVRAACAQAALEAYDQARFDGICSEGAIEAALEAVREVDVVNLVLAERGRTNHE